jgi:hypothetical protein
MAQNADEGSDGSLNRKQVAYCTRYKQQPIRDSVQAVSPAYCTRYKPQIRRARARRICGLYRVQYAGRSIRCSHENVRSPGRDCTPAVDCARGLCHPACACAAGLLAETRRGPARYNSQHQRSADRRCHSAFGGGPSTQAPVLASDRIGVGLHTSTDGASRTRWILRVAAN